MSYTGALIGITRVKGNRYIMSRSFAFVFPGQGSQSLKMMDGFLANQIITNTFAEASDILHTDFLAMLQDSSADTINQTINTQPLMLISGYATFLAWKSVSAKLPVILAGHSLGEWTALVASGVLSFSDALKLVKFRAKAMQDAVPLGVGAMAAIIGLDDNSVNSVCEQIANATHEVVAGANFNAPGQVVIAGDVVAVERAMLELKTLGAKMIKKLPVSVPSHCKLMLGASEKLAETMADVNFNVPTIPVLHNYNVASYTDPNAIKEALIKQLYSPVLWTQTIEHIVDLGVSEIIECGPGKVLSGLNRRINPDAQCMNFNTAVDFKNLFNHIRNQS